MSDQKLEQIVNEYAELAKDKNIDASALLINALEQRDNNRIATNTKRWAYLISIGVPPLGLLFAAWFYFGDKDDGQTAAIACIILTVVSSVIGILLIKSMLSGSGVTPQQLQEIKPADVYELAK